METSLHRQLKQLYAGTDAQLEVRIDGFRIDAVADGQLVEVQHGPLAAIRRKIERLVESHRVLLVKPIVVRKLLVRRVAQGGKVASRRASPKRGQLTDLFDELVYLAQIFPHQNLTLDVPLVAIEEWRFPGHGRRRRWRLRDHVVEDQKLVAVQQVHRFRTAKDLLKLIPPPVRSPFDTAELAAAMNVPRWVAQRVAYCLRHTGAAAEVGKRGNARLYRLARAA